MKFMFTEGAYEAPVIKIETVTVEAGFAQSDGEGGVTMPPVTDSYL